MLFRYINTIKFLRFSQLIYKLFYYIYRPSISFKEVPKQSLPMKKWDHIIFKNDATNYDNNFNFLNISKHLVFPKDWQMTSLGKLWIYNLHYFDFLNSKKSKTNEESQISLILNWIDSNPINQGIGWEPYPISLRIVNWIKWSIHKEKDDPIINKSICYQTRFLSRMIEHHISANHILANAKALIFSGLFFEGDEADEWLKKGISLYSNEINEQILNDGAHYERTPMYHAIIMEDILDIIKMNCCFLGRIETLFIEELKAKLNKMFIWLSAMTHPNGEYSFFNDCSNDIALSEKQLIKYAESLGLLVSSNLEDSHLFKNSGYIVSKKNNVYLLVDVARVGPDHQPGHGHADTHSFEMSLFEKKFIVNTGVSTYETNARRKFERSTKAHNTIVINSTNSSDVWKSFRVANRAIPSIETYEITEEFIKIVASHNGYNHLKGSPTHFRTWSLEKNKLVIEDKISGSFINAVANFYFHPLVKINSNNQIFFPTGESCFWKSSSGSPIIKECKWSYGFNDLRANQLLEIPFESETLVTEFFW